MGFKQCPSKLKFTSLNQISNQKFFNSYIHCRNRLLLQKTLCIYLLVTDFRKRSAGLRYIMRQPIKTAVSSDSKHILQGSQTHFIASSMPLLQKIVVEKGFDTINEDFKWFIYRLHDIYIHYLSQEDPLVILYHNWGSLKINSHDFVGSFGPTKNSAPSTMLCASACEQQVLFLLKTSK